MNIKFYGRLADEIAPQIDLVLEPGSSVGEVRRLLALEHPAAASSLSNTRTLACVGDRLVRDDHLVANNEHIEFLPPVSGG